MCNRYICRVIEVNSSLGLNHLRRTQEHAEVVGSRPLGASKSADLRVIGVAPSSVHTKKLYGLSDSDLGGSEPGRECKHNGAYLAICAIS